MDISEAREIIIRCWQRADPSSGQSYCTIDTGERLPPWLQPGDTYWYLDTVDGALEIGGTRVPLTTRWILCREHEHLAQPEPQD